MAFDFAATKAKARRMIHDTLSIEAAYLDKHLAAPVALRVRYHNKQNLIGDLQNEGYPMSVDGIDRVIFDVEELFSKGIKIARGGRLKITSPGYADTTLAIDTQDKSEGPIEEIWRVSKVGYG